MSQKRSPGCRRGKDETVAYKYYRTRELQSREFSAVAAIRRRREVRRVGAGEFILPFHQFIRQNKLDEVWIVLRESTHDQRRNQNHANYRFLADAVQRLGIRVHIVSVTCSAKLFDCTWRRTLKDVAHHANKRSAILAFSTDRLLRPEYFLSRRMDEVPMRAEFEELRRLTQGMPLLTWLDPDTSPRKARSKQTKLGQKTKDTVVGRPRKLNRAERKAALLPRVIELRQAGYGFCKIAGKVGLSSRTVWKWLRNAS